MTQCPFHHQGKSSLVSSGQLALANVENCTQRGDSVGVEKIEKMTARWWCSSKSLTQSGTASAWVWGRLGDRVSYRFQYFALGPITRLGQRLVMVAVGAQPAMLGAADSVLLHLPIFNRKSPCMMHNLPNNPGERDQSGPRWPRRPPKGCKISGCPGESLCPCSC